MEQKKNRLALCLKLILLVVFFIPLSIILFVLDAVIKLINWMMRKKETGGQTERLTDREM